ncbi:olfactory receptor 6C1-like [Discoglossus pictus]
MEKDNHTMVTYFILTGISDDPDLQAPIFFLILIMYLLTLGGNMTILVLVCLDHHLHTPMYFFLGNLSLMDMSTSTTTLNKILSNFIFRDNTISLLACRTHVFIYLSMVGAEMFLLTAMSYDRYVAICKPLHYHVVMNHTVCALLATICWMLGFLVITPHLILLSQLWCYRSNIVNHFFCDLVPVLNVSCNDISAFESLTLIEGFSVALTPFLLTLNSYIFINNNILKIGSSTGRIKAFYTCSSHLTVVIIFYGTIFIQYLRPRSNNSLEFTKYVSLFNTAVVPLINPVIYSLKNTDVKSAFRRQLRHCNVII